jgi:BlaI family transcriptional regulator, penicillinase repressor
MLGGLEQKIMEALWSQTEPQKPADIVKTLHHSHAYTSITTVLKRMADKKIVARKLRGNVFFYSPVQKKADYVNSCLDDLFARLFNSFGQDVVASFHRITKKQKIKT